MTVRTHRNPDVERARTASRTVNGVAQRWKKLCRRDRPETCFGTSAFGCGSADTVEKTCQPVSERTSLDELSGRDTDQMLHRLHVDVGCRQPRCDQLLRRHGEVVRRQDEPVVRESVEVGVTVIDRQDRRAHSACVGYSFQQRRGRFVGCDYEQGLAATRSLQAGQSDRQVRWRVRRRRPSDQGRRELRNAGETGLVVQVRSQVPGLLRRCAHEEQRAGLVRAPAQAARETTGALDPSGSSEQLTQHMHPGGIHGAMLPAREPC